MTSPVKYYLSVTGLVTKPFVYSSCDLVHFGTVDSAGCDDAPEGIPLRALLEIARIPEGLDPTLSIRISNGEETIFLPLDDIMNIDYHHYRVILESARDGDSSSHGESSGGDQSFPSGMKKPPCLVMPRGILMQGIRSIEVIEETEKGKDGLLLVIGVGPGDESMLTLQAISAMASADCFIASADMVERFAPFMAGKPVLYDPMECALRYMAKRNPGRTPEEVGQIVEANRKRHGRMIAREVESGRVVALLDYGDPSIYGNWSYWVPDVLSEEKIRIFPAISSFNAGNALIGRNIMYSGTAVLTTPEGIISDPGLIGRTAVHGDTVVIFVGLHDLDRIMPILEKAFTPDTPVAVAYKAGFRSEEFLLKTDLAGIQEKVKQYDETHLALIYIGPSAGTDPVEFMKLPRF